MVAVCALTLAAACGGGSDAPASSAGETPLTSGQTAFARKLGGAGFETAAGIATCPDGSIVAASHIGGYGPMSQPWGLTRISAAGQTLWAKTFPMGEGGIAGLACSPLGNVFVGLDVMSGLLDLGGGQIFGGAVVKLTPAGEFTWQHVVRDSLLTSFAVDGNGSVLASFIELYELNPWHAMKLRWDGAVLWEVSEDDGADGLAPRAAWDPAGNAIVATSAAIRKYTADGAPVWTARFTDPVTEIVSVGTTNIGTVVVSGTYSSLLRIGGATLEQGSGPGAFALVLEGVDAHVRWVKNRVSGGPMAVDPVGRIAFIDRAARPQSGADCIGDLVRWDLTGTELWRRPLVTCGTNAENGQGAWGTGVAIGPNSQIWAQGYAWTPFDPGTGTTYVPQDFDWFIMRVAP